jgi:NTE family protein
MSSTFRGVVALVLSLVSAACQAPDVYKNKSVVDSESSEVPALGTGGYRLAAIPNNAASPDLLFLLTFSGGGKRSSAFSYGVLRGLKDIDLGSPTTPRSLLDEVDGIGSVSGGTFTAAYYGLHRERIFSDYENDFLKQDIESYIWGLYVLPWRWGWWLHPFYGTNDAMQRVYDDLMFHGATYADLKKRGSPVIWIGATDISYGRVFTFNQDTFDLLCSDLDSFPLARAVAASNGFPVLFTPITLENYAHDCKGWRPSWTGRPPKSGQDSQARHQVLVEAAEDYLDTSRTPYVHLSDGGIVDNLALRGLLNTIIAGENDPEFQRTRNLLSLRRILILVADGQAAQDKTLAQERVVTGLGQIINAVSGSQIDNYNFETLSIMRVKLGETVQQFRAARCNIAPTIEGHPCDDVEGYLLHFSLSSISDDGVRMRLQSIPTGLTISDEDVDALIQAGESQVKSSPVIDSLVKSLKEKSSTGKAGL